MTTIGPIRTAGPYSMPITAATGSAIKALMSTNYDQLIPIVTADRQLNVIVVVGSVA